MAGLRSSLVVAGVGAMLAVGAGCTFLASFNDDASGDGGVKSATGLMDGSLASSGNGGTDASIGTNDNPDATTGGGTGPVGDGDASTGSTTPDGDVPDVSVSPVDAACVGRVMSNAQSTESPQFGTCSCQHPPSNAAWTCTPPSTADAAVTCHSSVDNQNSLAPPGTMYSCSDGNSFSFLDYFTCSDCVPTPNSMIGAICNPCNTNENGTVCMALPDQYPTAAAIVTCDNGRPTQVHGCGDSTCCGTCTL